MSLEDYQNEPPNKTKNEMLLFYKGLIIDMNKLKNLSIDIK